MDFKVLKHRTGEEYPSKYSDGKPELFINHVKDMEKRYDVSLPKIESVYIGDSEYPIDEIWFEDGLRLYVEETSLIPSTPRENKARIDNWLAAKEERPIKYNDH